METTGSKSVFDALKLDRFDGTNFTPCPKIPAPSDEDTDAIKASRKKREEDEVRCRGYILNALSDRLHDLFRSIKSPHEIWSALEYKYTSEKQGTDRFLSMKFFEFQMVDNKSVMDQVDELLVLVSSLKDLKIEVSEQLQVAAVIAKLPTTWNGYRKKLLHISENFTIDQLMKHIRIEEETRIRENKFALESGSKVNNVESSIMKVGYSRKKRKFVETSSENIANKKKNKTSYFCGKVEGKAGKRIANLVEHPASTPDIVAMVADLKISMLTECNMATNEKSSDWWYDSGATIHVCNEKGLLKNYELAEKEDKVLMGNHDTAMVLGRRTIELQFTSGKKVILMNVLHVPDVRKNLISTSLLCKKGLKAVIEAEKLILSKNGDDPKTYDEAIASRNSSFWKEAINNEKDSLLANGTWVLVHLPPNSKPIGCKWVFRRKYNTDGSLHTFKARLTTKGFRQKEGVDYFDTYAPIVRITSIRALFALASFYNLHVHQMDVKTTFLNGELDEKIYMKQPKYFILLGNENKVCYTDASWITSVDENRSASGWIFTLGGGAISWASKKQACITHSTMESEFSALAAVGKEVEWLRNLSLDIKLWPQSMPAISLHCDSQATMSKAFNKIYNGKYRHIALRHEYIRHLISDDIITVVYIRSSKNLADPLTKRLSRDIIKNTTTSMDLKLF
ncbi:uncharacterized protein [Primulina eburnea]|uniref:uncharacterized protein n=1 Tax=Primulina eburnea TaxID=1245227 RepID=UPI003C6BE30C